MASKKSQKEPNVETACGGSPSGDGVNEQWQTWSRSASMAMGPVEGFLKVTS